MCIRDRDNAYETTLTVTDPTADRTITLPNVTGTVVTTGDTGTVDATMLAANSVDSSELVDGSIDTSHIADSQVTAAKLGSSAVTTVKIATDAVTGAKIADDSIDSEHYVDGSIDTAHIADSQITEAKIATNAITENKVNDNSVSEGKLMISNSGTNGYFLQKQSGNTGGLTWANVTTTTIADDAVTTAKVADDAITDAKLADHASNNANRAVDSNHIKTNAIITEKIAGTAVTDVKLASNSVTESKILDANVTTDKLAADSVTIAKIGCEQTTISNSDSHIPTSGAVVDYVAAQIAPIGGLEVIADEDNFPTSQPGAGVVISISDAAGIVVNGSGVSTTARTAGNGSDNVTINNFPSSLYGETLATGVGLMVSSTGSSQTYNYHKILAAETDVKQLSDDINDFNARYRVNAGEPGSNNDEGDLVYDTNANKMKVYDTTTSAWKEVTSSGDFKYLFLCPAGGSGAPTLNGSIATYDLRESSNSGSAASVTSAAQLIVSINGVIQKANTGTSAPAEGFALVDSNTIIFGANLQTGDSVFIVQIGSAITISTPGDGTVSEAKIVSGAVTTAKIADDAVDQQKIAGNSILNANISSSAAIAGSKLADGGISTAKIADEAVTLAKLEHGTSSNDGKFLRANNGADPTFETVNTTPEGTAILSTGETGGTKFLREDGDNSCSWQSIPAGTTINNNADNRVITGSGTANTLEGEANLTFDGSDLTVTNSGVSNKGIKLTATGNYYPSIAFDANRSAENNAIMWLNGKWNGTDVGSISIEAGDDTTNKDDGKITFYTAQGGTSTRKMAIEQDGHIHIDDGDLKFASGHGIDFSATADGSGSSQAELFDDYEEGTWTPTVSSSNASFSTMEGRYVKVGRMVSLWFKISGGGSYSGSGALEIGGLPFTNNTGVGVTGTSEYYKVLFSDSYSDHCTPYVTGSNIKWLRNNSGNGSGNYLTVGQLYTSAAIKTFICYGTDS